MKQEEELRGKERKGAEPRGREKRIREEREIRTRQVRGSETESLRHTRSGLRHSGSRALPVLVGPEVLHTPTQSLPLTSHFLPLVLTLQVAVSWSASQKLTGANPGR